MSKKIMKRSLVLGTLMAFVITGSAMAAIKYSDTAAGTSAENPRVLTGELPNGGLVNTWTGELYSNGQPKNGMFLNVNSCNETYWDITNNQVNINAHSVTNNNNPNSKGIWVNGFNFIGNENSNMTIDSDGAGIHGYGSIGSEDKKIGTLKIFTDKQGILNNSKNSTGVEIYVNNLIIDAEDDAVQSTKSSITINADNVYVTKAAKALNISNSTANIIADNFNISGADEASRVKSNGVLNLTVNESGQINSDFQVGSDSKGTLNMTLGSDVIFNGKINTEDSSNSVSNITLNGATWNVSGDSEVTTLAGNSGKLELAYDNEAERFVKVDIDNLTNEALEVTGGEKLTQAIESGKVNVSNEEVLADLAEAVTAAEGSIAVVKIEEGNILGEVIASVGEDGKIVAGSVKEAVNTVNKSIGEASVVGMAHIRAHMNDMNKRMGELRMANGESGVWTRMVRGEEEFAGAKSQYNQYQLGYDEKLSVDKRWTVGAAVTFAEGNGNFANGSTENDSTAFAIYGSKLNNDGTFVDLIARYARFESDITVADAKADYSTNGMSVSAEFGKRIQQGNGLWIEPQVELTYGTVDSAEYTIAGRNVQVGDMDSLIGRVGFSLGKDIKEGNVYARASYLYDFDGETETTFAKGDVTRTIAEDLGGGWWEVGVGANINLSKATYIYADVEKTFGGEVDTNWKWNLGVRYSF